MKKLIVLAFLGLFTAPKMWSQAPKYALLEHFTNTRCGICGSANPALFNRINVNANAKLHHISYHWSVPYNGCIFYQANTAPQDARAAFNNIGGSPQVAINGNSVVSAGSVTATTVDNVYCQSCSPVEVKVTEVDNGDGSRSARTSIKSVGTPPSGNFRLLVALVEKTVNYAAPNSETVHHNVFRQFLTPSAGVPVTLPAQGGGTSLVVYNYTPAPSTTWTSGEFYVVSWVFNETTKEVLNSATKFDAAPIPVELTTWKGVAEDTKNRFEWTTATEINTNFFDIERSDDSKNFESVGRIKAAGQSNSPLTYAFEDEKSLQKTNYYRLKTVDLDGSFSLSNTIAIVRNGKNDKTLSLYPSPTNQNLNVVYEADSKRSEWRILDGLGKVVQQSFGSKNAIYTEGSLSEVLDVSALPNGLYLFQLIQQNGTQVARFVKN